MSNPIFLPYVSTLGGTPDHGKFLAEQLMRTCPEEWKNFVIKLNYDNSSVDVYHDDLLVRTWYRNTSFITCYFEEMEMEVLDNERYKEMNIAFGALRAAGIREIL